MTARVLRQISGKIPPTVLSAFAGYALAMLLTMFAVSLRAPQPLAMTLGGLCGLALTGLLVSFGGEHDAPVHSWFAHLGSRRLGTRVELVWTVCLVLCVVGALLVWGEGVPRRWEMLPSLFLYLFSLLVGAFAVFGSIAPLSGAIAEGFSGLRLSLLIVVPIWMLLFFVALSAGGSPAFMAGLSAVALGGACAFLLARRRTGADDLDMLWAVMRFRSSGSVASRDAALGVERELNQLRRRFAEHDYAAVLVGTAWVEDSDGKFEQRRESICLRAVALAKLSRHVDARRVLDLLATTFESDGLVLNTSGLLAWFRGDVEAAADATERALDLGSALERALAANNYAYFACERLVRHARSRELRGARAAGEYGEQLKCIDAIAERASMTLSRTEREGQLWDTRGWIRLLMGDVQGAREFMMRGAVLRRLSPMATTHLVLAFAVGSNRLSRSLLMLDLVQRDVALEFPAGSWLVDRLATSRVMIERAREHKLAIGRWVAWEVAGWSEAQLDAPPDGASESADATPSRILRRTLDALDAVVRIR